jgi:catechol 2,3-dioxygenase-like lactoylglutathione lyase family enzyme
MIPVRGLFESHLTVGNLERSVGFYGGTLGLKLAHVVPERQVAFYWLGDPGTSMLGLWEVGTIKD